METKNQITTDQAIFDLVLIPRKDLEALEAARKELFQLHENSSITERLRLVRVTTPIWKLTHKKYPSV